MEGSYWTCAKMECHVETIFKFLLVSDLDPQPSAALGRNGDDFVAVRVDVSLARRLIQLKRPSFLAVIQVVPAEQSGEDNSHLAPCKVHAAYRAKS